MAYEITCPNGHKLQVTEAHFNRQVRCPTCGEPFMVPDLSAGAAGAPEQPAAREPTARPSYRARAAAGGTGFQGFGQSAGAPLLILGLILVIAARGCDLLGKRSVERAQARRRLSENRFNDRYQTKVMRLDERYDAYAKASPPDTKGMSDVQKQKNELRKEWDEERQGLQKGEWRDLEISARDADDSNRVQAYWREMAFLVGTLGLAIGLMAKGFTAQGAERWICLMMLAIITFSIFVFGIAWVPK